jgi:16S rRNA (uracil1498-N3)-methyltransferase
MSVPRIYVSQNLAVSQQFELIEDRFHYVKNVLRLAPQDKLILFNGQGGEFEATIVSVAKRACLIAIDNHQPIERESPLQIQLIQGIARGKKMDLIIQKATELGVTRITPVIGDHNKMNLAKKAELSRFEHWRLIAISSCEQCGRNKIPEIDMPLTLAESLQLDKQVIKKYYLDPRAKVSAANELVKTNKLQFCIGPEGGFSGSETSLLEESGFIGLQLGPRILRTETAAIAAMSLLQALCGDLM